MDRYHNFELLIYYEDTIFDSIIKSDNNILHYAYILHDKDINEDKSLKVPHYHLLVNFKNAKTFNACLSQFTIPSYNTRVIPIKDNKKQERFEYLYHLNNVDKFQYSKDSIITDNVNFWLNVSSVNTEKTCNLIDDIINKRPLRELMETYGRDFVINYQKYISFANELVYNESNAGLKDKSYSFCADTHTGEVKGTEDCAVDTDFLLKAFKKD